MTDQLSHRPSGLRLTGGLIYRPIYRPNEGRSINLKTYRLINQPTDQRTTERRTEWPTDRQAYFNDTPTKGMYCRHIDQPVHELTHRRDDRPTDRPTGRRICFSETPTDLSTEHVTFRHTADRLMDRSTDLLTASPTHRPTDPQVYFPGTPIDLPTE